MTVQCSASVRDIKTHVLTAPIKSDRVQIVAVGSDTMKPFTHALALGLYLWVPTEGSSKRLFYCNL